MNSNLLAQIANPTIDDPLADRLRGAQAGNALMQYSNAREANALAPAAMRGDKNALAQLSGVDPTLAAKYDQTAYDRKRQGVVDANTAQTNARAAHQDMLKQGVQAMIQASADPQSWEAFRQQAIAKTGHDIGGIENAPKLIENSTRALDPVAAAARDASTARASAGNDPYGLAPIFGTDANGNVVVMQTSKAGGMKVADAPAGVTPMGPGDKAAATSAGKVQGAAAVSLPGVENAARRMQEQLDAVLNDKGLDSVTGFVGGRTPRAAQMPGAAALQSKIDLIQGNTFLAAYEALRGAGAITEQEGQAAKDAITRLSTQTMSATEYKAAIKEAKREIDKLVGIARQKAGKGSPAGPDASANAGAGDQIQAGSKGNPITVDDENYARQLPQGTFFRLGGKLYQVN